MKTSGTTEGETWLGMDETPAIMRLFGSCPA